MLCAIEFSLEGVNLWTKCIFFLFLFFCPKFILEWLQFSENSLRRYWGFFPHSSSCIKWFVCSCNFKDILCIHMYIVTKFIIKSILFEKCFISTSFIFTNCCNINHSWYFKNIHYGIWDITDDEPWIVFEFFIRQECKPSESFTINVLESKKIQ